eukprot:m.31960 g.31960  ORF g.31960 m.31960 type:complete len:100 (+) comp5435_c0_seq2:1372-1671(+)
MSSQPQPPPEDDTPYVSLFAHDRQETTREKFRRKFSENPAVPVFVGLTGAALVTGLVAFKRGNQRVSQAMQRARVGFQFLTVVALVGGSYVSFKPANSQ